MLQPFEGPNYKALCVFLTEDLKARLVQTTAVDKHRRIELWFCNGGADPLKPAGRAPDRPMHFIVWHDSGDAYQIFAPFAQNLTLEQQRVHLYLLCNPPEVGG